MTGKFKIAAIAIFSAVIGLAASTSHADVTGVVPVNTGSSYDGWTVTYSQGNGISLLQDVDSAGTHLVLEKFADFKSTSSFLIDFAQTPGAQTTSSTITITNEMLFNNSNANWSGFEFVLVPLSGSASITSVFVPPTGGGVNYTNVSSTSTSVTYTGSQPVGTASAWGEQGGATTGGQLVITTSGGPGNFILKEIPLTVPVPAAAWSGLTGLMGLGLLATGKKLKKILA